MADNREKYRAWAEKNQEYILEAFDHTPSEARRILKNNRCTIICGNDDMELFLFAWNQDAGEDNQITISDIRDGSVADFEHRKIKDYDFYIVYEN